MSLDQETMRIQNEYKRRDSQQLNKCYQYENPAFQFHMQEREWMLMSMLRLAKVDLSNMDMLEVGCGTGHILNRFIEFGVRRVYGLDLMGERLKTGARCYNNAQWIQGNAATLPFATQSFDLVTQFMCISSVIEPTIRQMVAKEMWRVLRPGGWLLHYDMRPLPCSLQLAGKIARGAGLIRPKKVMSTPIIPVSKNELYEWFPSIEFHIRSVSLRFEFAELARYSHCVAHLLSRLPFLRSHYLALIRKT